MASTAAAEPAARPLESPAGGTRARNKPTTSPPSGSGRRGLVIRLPSRAAGAGGDAGDQGAAGPSGEQSPQQPAPGAGSSQAAAAAAAPAAAAAAAAAAAPGQAAPRGRARPADDDADVVVVSSGSDTDDDQVVITAVIKRPRLARQRPHAQAAQQQQQEQQQQRRGGGALPTWAEAPPPERAASPEPLIKCLICLEGVGMDNLATTPCGHLFCFQPCLFEQVKKNKQCPKCRKKLQKAASAAPRPPPPRPLSPAKAPHQAALVRELRLWLRASGTGEGQLPELTALLQRSGLAPPAAAELAAAAGPLEGLRPVEPAQLVDLETGLERLRALFGDAGLERLLRAEPRLLRAELAAWLDFFVVYGFSAGQIKNLIATSPEILVESSVARAGAAILHLKKSHGFDDEQVRHVALAFAPQLLAMEPADIDVLIGLWKKFQDVQGTP
ncbi:hypothetical protein HT031_005733 [Scenedesmus sp. PABB004]|nr:hypothetical protein HT031_005733 [Scenedesmus sp. PABB004]